MTFDFCRLVTTTAQLEVNDEFNCFIRATNSLNYEYYMAVYSNLGITNIIEYGPIVSDLNSLPNDLNYNYHQFSTNNKKIVKAINTFLNDYEKGIVEAEEITFEEMKIAIKNPIDYLFNI